VVLKWNTPAIPHMADSLRRFDNRSATIRQPQ
jgi:hypothetical protein